MPYICTDESSLFRGVVNGGDAASVGAWSVTIGGGGAKATFVGAVGCIPIIFEMKFFSGLRRIDCRARFTHNGESIGNADIPGRDNGFFHGDKLRFILNTCLGGEIKNIRDLPYEIAETDEPEYIQGNYWVARCDKNIGLAYFTSGSRGAVIENAGFSLPLAYANKYIWGTRMLYGESAHEFAIYPFTPEADGYVSLHKAAVSYAFPPLTIETGAHGGRFESECRVIDVIGGAGVIMTAMYPEDGAVLVRVCGYSGNEENYSPPSSRFGMAGGRVTIMNEPVGNAAACNDGKSDGADNGSNSGGTDNGGKSDGSGGHADASCRVGLWEIVTHRIYKA